jgi:hypothetical protein
MRLTGAIHAPIDAASVARFVVWQKPQPDSEMALMILVCSGACRTWTDARDLN